MLSFVQIRYLFAATTALVLASAPVSGQQSPPARKVAPAQGVMSTPAYVPYNPSTVSRLRVPAGFRISVFADQLGGVRMLAVAGDGTVYVTRRDSADVLAFTDDGTGRGSRMRKVVTNLKGVHGIALHQGKMYLATVREVYVAAMAGDGSVGEPKALITDLPDGGQHPSRTIGFGADGMLYISVGSTCNQCPESNDESATMLRSKPDGSERGIFAHGLRNTIGFGWHPVTGELWGMDHGSDWKGNDLPPEELNKIEAAAHYGWPFCFATKRVDETFAGYPEGSNKAEFCPRTVAPALMYQAHSAPIQMTFYTGSQFPAVYKNDAFVVFRGSWNREPPTGYKVARVSFDNGRPTRFEDFVTGFLSPGGDTYFGRPAGIAVAGDGSLLLSDDTSGVIYRISHDGRASR